ncbi:hypothetical protein JQ824_04435 [Brachyspira hyodysenteriae]|uniref:Histidine kinase n=2 Tax=Brachyspira hyodysenteriae TaxID=159 RepID=A0A3B6W303_BRAHO|nr:hypothetical protein [Brachyspira hyodysenteriae]ANN62853.1 hypothetical protein BHYOB78_02945 [Brachyspira hyodysenteriae ATCC 27164]KLI13430.1 hypothetical protein SU45_12995 [Brachyspira hyodysenteriae]KLI15621.1 hypothetical protein SU44_07320 [Brachyspira hyodysenteriae]KLI19751.1 hypothetical protein SU46_06605 [Brachyspira hyodysenteriae]KLI23242.1 hypothetical protein SZ47_11560 [Brachyspira hyodysenteriae]
MRKIILIIIAICSAYIYAYSQDANFQDIYEKMKEKYSSMYPRKFEAYIDGKIVQRQIDTIPAKSYTKTKEDIKLRFTFEKGYKPTMILENVDSFYRNMFSVFEGALETVGFYTLVGNNNTYDSISKKFTFESIEDKKDEYKITLRAKGENENYSVTYIVNKDTYIIERAEYYNKKSKMYDVNILYEEVEDYTLPKTIKYKSSDGKVNSEIEFVDIKTYK